MLSFFTEANWVAINTNGIVDFMINIGMLYVGYLQKFGFFMGKSHTILLTVVGGEEEDVVELGELVGRQDGVICESNGGDDSRVRNIDSLSRFLSIY